MRIALQDLRLDALYVVYPGEQRYAIGPRTQAVPQPDGSHRIAGTKIFISGGDHDLADKVYSSVPARVFGRKQEIEIGHYSGRSNVLYWLRAHGYEPSDELVDRVFNFAKLQNHTLTTDEVKAIIGS